MLTVDDNNIKLTRGDTARFGVSIINEATSQAYTILSTDVLIMTIKKTVNDTTPLVQKTLTGSNVFHILPTDTNDLDYGRYVYDVQLNLTGGDIYTVIPPKMFYLTKEVTF